MNANVRLLVKSDVYRSTGRVSKGNFVKLFFNSRTFRFTFFFRMVVHYSKWSFIGFVSRVFYNMYTDKLGFQIPKSVKIGKGFQITHFGHIVINSSAVIGDNCTIYPGVTIGATFRGPDKGVPVVGNQVWIGTGAVLVGKITVGDNVLIAPNAYINLSVPSNSVVFGNPAIIKPRVDAVAGYIENAFL